MDVMSMKQHNHHCIVCDTGYHFCDDCSKINSFTPWRTIACSIECYQAHLAWLEYRDINHDAKKFAEMIDYCGIDQTKMHEALRTVYAKGLEEKGVKAEAKTEDKANTEVKTKKSTTSKARKK